MTTMTTTLLQLGSQQCPGTSSLAQLSIVNHGRAHTHTPTRTLTQEPLLTCIDSPLARHNLKVFDGIFLSSLSPSLALPFYLPLYFIFSFFSISIASSIVTLLRFFCLVPPLPSPLLPRITIAFQLLQFSSAASVAI